jgi:translation initiation factor 3 subunit E
MFIFQEFCRIHQTIDLKMLSEKLGMDLQAAELWIANLIRNARLNAKIDNQAGTVVMKQSYSSPYDQVVEKMKGLSNRTFALSNTLIGTGKV